MSKNPLMSQLMIDLLVANCDATTPIILVYQGFGILDTTGTNTGNMLVYEIYDRNVPMRLNQQKILRVDELAHIFENFKANPKLFLLSQYGAYDFFQRFRNTEITSIAFFPRIQNTIDNGSSFFKSIESLYNILGKYRDGTVTMKLDYHAVKDWARMFNIEIERDEPDEPFTSLEDRPIISWIWYPFFKGLYIREPSGLCRAPSFNAIVIPLGVPVSFKHTRYNKYLGYDPKSYDFRYSITLWDTNASINAQWIIEKPAKQTSNAFYAIRTLYDKFPRGNELDAVYLYKGIANQVLLYRNTTIFTSQEWQITPIPNLAKTAMNFTISTLTGEIEGQNNLDIVDIIADLKFNVPGFSNNIGNWSICNMDNFPK